MTRTACILWILLMTACGSGTQAPAPLADPLEERPAEALHQMGIERARQRDYVRAEQYLAAAIARGYPEAEAIGPLVAVCLRSARLRAALGYAAPYLKRRPDAWPLRHLVAAVYLALDEPARARDELEQVLEEAPRHAPSRYLLGVTLREKLGAPEDAAQAFRAYLEIAPEGPHALEARAFVERYDEIRATAGPERPTQGQAQEVRHDGSG